jgi:hypothetical protein
VNQWILFFRRTVSRLSLVESATPRTWQPAADGSLVALTPIVLHMLPFTTGRSRNGQPLGLRELRPCRSGPTRKITSKDTITILSNRARAHEYPNRSRNAYSTDKAGEANKTPS